MANKAKAFVFVDDEACKGCGLCVSVCPKNIMAINIVDRINSKGYLPAECIDQPSCIGCTFCAMMCPDLAITITTSS